MAKRRDKRPQKPPLFNRPMNELREAFVRTRFAEERCFGRPDIEEWLAREREAERPEYDHGADESQWNTVLSSDHMLAAAISDPLTALEHATQIAVPPPDSEHPYDQQAVRDQLAPICATLGRSARVYYGHTFGIVIVTEYPEGMLSVYNLEAHVKPPNTAFLLRKLDGHALTASMAIVDVLFAEWLYGRPRWREARQFLCDALAKDIQKERLGAETDFDLAVATSEDGAEIVHADFVVTSTRALGANDKPLAPADVRRIHAADLYPDHKVLLCARDQRGRGRIAASSDDYALALTSILTACASEDAPRQYLAEMADGKKILVTHPDLMPELEDLDAPPWSDEKE